MKQYRELDPKELTMEQKLGMIVCVNVSRNMEDVDIAVDLIRRHALGAVYIQPTVPHCREGVRKILDAADYPVLIFGDAEQGFGEYKIPYQISLTAVGAREDYAYSYGKVTAQLMHGIGYNVITNPQLDMTRENMPCAGTLRTYGGDPETVAKIGLAVARGTREGGCLVCAKHYPGHDSDVPFDSHMREGVSDLSREELVNTSLYPYRRLNEEGLLDSVMVGHWRFPSVDPEYPASLSAPVLSLLREQGFDGVFITDALNMMGIALKHGKMKPAAMSIAAGNDIALPWYFCKPSYDYMQEGYRQGLLSDADVERALSRVLAMMHKVTLLPDAQEPSRADLDNIAALNRDCVTAVCEEGLCPAVSPDGRHFIILLTDGKSDLNVAEEYTPENRNWYFPGRIAAQLRELFPNSKVFQLPDYPRQDDMILAFSEQMEYDDVIFITYLQSGCYLGREHLTGRVVDLMDALQTTDRIAAHVHLGNPFVAADAPYVKRVIIGYPSVRCVENTLRVLHGDIEARGVLPYGTIRFHQKGHVFY